jgi:hypothetical protein
MNPKGNLRVRTLGLVVLMVLCTSTGDVLLRGGMRRIGPVRFEPAALVSTFAKTVTSGMIWLGIACLLSAMMCYLMLLSWADYSYVMPASSFGYAVVALMGVLVLREDVTSVRWAGVALICLGVALVGRTEPRTTRAG